MNPKNSKILSLGASLLVGLTACASSEHQTVTQGDPYSDPSKFESLASNAYTMPVAAVATTPAEPVKVEQATNVLSSASLVSPAIAFVPETAPLAVNRAPASVTKTEDAVTPETAYTNLIRGNERFVTGMVKGERRDSVRRREVASVENPFAIVLSCSDSRVPPELIFDQGLGELLTIRVAGNVLGSAQVASIEDAIEHLGAKLILVMGHESCGAVKSALETTDHKTHAANSSPDLNWLMTSIRPALKARGLASVQADDPKLRKPVMANIDSVTESLIIRSKIIGDAIGKGSLKVVRGIYSLDTGRVDFWGMK